MKHRAFLLATPVAPIPERWETDDGNEPIAAMVERNARLKRMWDELLDHSLAQTNKGATK